MHGTNTIIPPIAHIYLFIKGWYRTVEATVPQFEPHPTSKLRCKFMSNINILTRQNFSLHIALFKSVVVFVPLRNSIVICLIFKSVKMTMIKTCRRNTRDEINIIYNKIFVYSEVRRASSIKN